MTDSAQWLRWKGAHSVNKGEFDKAAYELEQRRVEVERLNGIVDRLRTGKTQGTDLRFSPGPTHLEAADEIERLREALEDVLHQARAQGHSRTGRIQQIVVAALKEEKE
jgi:hypothetical protein